MFTAAGPCPEKLTLLILCEIIFYMILYYSATGNTEFAAKEIARLTDDTALNLLQKIQTSDYSEINSEKPFVICAPIYVCEIPNFLDAFLKRVKLSGSREMYFVFTSGGYSGIASRLAGIYCRHRGLIYKGSADIIMPRNYIASDAYPMQDGQMVKARIAAARDKIKETAEMIKEVVREVQSKCGIVRKTHCRRLLCVTV